MGLAGGIASIGGILDWSYHRWVARCKIGQAEKRLELLAMGVGGGSMLTDAECFHQRQSGKVADTGHGGADVHSVDDLL